MTTRQWGLNWVPDVDAFSFQDRQVDTRQGERPALSGDVLSRLQTCEINSSSFDPMHARKIRTLTAQYFTGFQAQPQLTWQCLTLWRWPMPGSVDSPGCSSGGREASTGWFTRSSWCFVESICFSVYFTGDSPLPRPAVLSSSCPLSLNSPSRFMLTPMQREVFERVALYCDQFTNTNVIPVLFVLGESPGSSKSGRRKKVLLEKDLFFLFLLQVSM